MFISILEKKIHYRVKGTGPAILFVHGWGGSIESLEALSQQFTSYTSVTLDLPGFGNSDLPDPSWGVEKYAEVIVKLCEKLHFEEIVYFGHSFGGALGIYLAVHKPTLISKLILCSASFKRTARRTDQSGEISLTKSISKLFPTTVKKIIYKIFFPTSDSFKYPAIESNFRKIITHDLTPFLTSIRIPTLIVWGEKDLDTPVSLAYELHNKIKGSKLAIIPEATHGVPLKLPVQVYRNIIEFL